MRIRTKLNILIVGIILFFSIAIMIFVLNIIQTSNINEERNVLTQLLISYHLLSKYNTQIYTEDLEASYKKFNESFEKTKQIMKQAGGLKYLPKLNPEIENSLTIIQNLFQLQATRIGKLDKSVKKIMQVFAEISGFKISFVISDIPVNHLVQGKPRYDEMLQLRKDVETAISSMSLDSAIDELFKQNAFIENKVKNTRMVGLIISLIITAIIIIVSLIGSMFIASSIRKPLLNIRREVKALTTGDLTGQFEASGNDEIADLMRDLNIFLTKLKQSIGNIQGISQNNVQIKENLIKSTEESSIATKQIGMNMDSVYSQFKTLDGSVKQSVDSINNIRFVIQNESSQIQDQIVMVEQSTAAVTQMIASIQSVANITELNKDAAVELVESAKAGGAKLKVTSEVIAAVNDNIENIRGMVNLIQSISGQTNLLAMNAAIEAAHAGDAGRGFAVVADEIRSLAEASAKSSKNITSSLKNIVKRITSAHESAAATTAAFTNIDEKIHIVERSFSEILESMKELEKGGTQILEAMHKLQEVSVTVNDGSARMNESSDIVFGAVQEVHRFSTESIESISEIISGTKEIGTAIEYLVTLSSEIQDISINLDKSISFFVLGKLEQENEELIEPIKSAE